MSRAAARCLAATALLAVVATACSTAHGSGGNAAPAAVRWWSDSAASAGSRIDPAHPGAAAQGLRPSRTQYCAVLRQTLDSGSSILAGVGAHDPARVAATTAFVTELEHLAPAPVQSAWAVVGPVVTALVKPGAGTPAMSNADAARVAAATETINTDAKSECGLELQAKPSA